MAREKSRFLYDGLYVTAQELADKLQPLAKDGDLKIYAKGKAVIFDYGTFTKKIYSGQYGKHWTTVLDDYFKKQVKISP